MVMPYGSRYVSAIILAYFSCFYERRQQQLHVFYTLESLLAPDVIFFVEIRVGDSELDVGVGKHHAGCSPPTDYANSHTHMYSDTGMHIVVM